jgi:hypothetical protein
LEKFPENFFSYFRKKNDFLEKISGKISVRGLTPLLEHRKRGYIRGDTGRGEGVLYIGGVV